jgi:hypothetical protein
MKIKLNVDMADSNMKRIKMAGEIVTVKRKKL